jgi:hypothetical protein
MATLKEEDVDGDELALMRRYYPGSTKHPFLPRYLTCTDTSHSTLNCPQRAYFFIEPRPRKRNASPEPASLKRVKAEPEQSTASPVHEATGYSDYPDLEADIELLDKWLKARGKHQHSGMLSLDSISMKDEGKPDIEVEDDADFVVLKVPHN